MIVVVKIVGDAGLRVGLVGKNGPLAEFEHLRFEAGLETFILVVVVAPAAAALRMHGPVLVQRGAAGGGAVMPVAVRVHDEVGRGRLGPKAPL